MTGCLAQTWRPAADQDPYIWSFGLQWVHRLICHHTWHTDHTNVTICVCCLKANRKELR